MTEPDIPATPELWDQAFLAMTPSLSVAAMTNVNAAYEHYQICDQAGHFRSWATVERTHDAGIDYVRTRFSLRNHQLFPRSTGPMITRLHPLNGSAPLITLSRPAKGQAAWQYLLENVPEPIRRFAFKKRLTTWTPPNGAPVFFDKYISMTLAGDVLNSDTQVGATSEFETRQVAKTLTAYCKKALSMYATAKQPAYAQMLEWAQWWSAGPEGRALWEEVRYKQQHVQAWYYATNLYGCVFTKNMLAQLTNRTAEERTCAINPQVASFMHNALKAVIRPKLDKEVFLL